MATVEICVNMMDGAATTIEVNEDATVSDTKLHIEEVLGVPSVEQRLTYRGDVLDNRLQPFAEIACSGESILLLTVPSIAMLEFASAQGFDDPRSSPKSLDKLLYKAAAACDERVCLEILAQEKFGDNTISPPRPDLLRALAVPGLADAFQCLVDHPGYGQIDGLLNQGQDILHFIAKKGLALHCESLLASSNYQVVVEGPTTPLHHAANAATLRALLRREELSTQRILNAIDTHGCTCLHYASSMDACKVILEHPEFASVNVQDEYGQTPLHCARNAEVCRTILSRPDFSSVNARDKKYQTALHIAARIEPVCLALLNNGVEIEIDAADAQGKTALHNARSSAVVQALFDHGFSNINAVDGSGRTALHGCSDPSIARLILAHPCFTSVNELARGYDYENDDVTFTAITVAAAHGHDDVVKAILEGSQMQVEVDDALENAGRLRRGTQSALKAYASTSDRARAAGPAPTDSGGPVEGLARSTGAGCTIH